MSEQRKWRRIPPPPPPEVVLEERIGPHLVHVEAFKHGDKQTPLYRAIQVCGGCRSMIAVSAGSAEEALLQAARVLGFEPVKEEP